MVSASAVPVLPLIPEKRLAAVNVPGVTPELFPWEAHPIPARLYKYLRPERLGDLTKCLIRFSQRKVFADTFELLPEVAQFGTADEIRTFMELDPVLSTRPLWLRNAVIARVKLDPTFEAQLISQTKGRLTSPDEFAVLCLSEHHDSERMWEEYADHGRGFVVAFNTAHPKFALLRQPGRMGRVEYSDEPIASFLGAYGPNALFRKRTRYAFEAEWRSIRHVKRFHDVVNADNALPIHLGGFDASCIQEIFIRDECAVEWELRHLVTLDARYRHLPITFVYSKLEECPQRS